MVLNFVVLTLLTLNVAAWKVVKPSISLMRSSSLKMCEVPQKAEVPEELQEFVPETNFFDSNRIVRLGRSRDQDGKSNIWSIEPRMVVEDKEEPANNFLIFGIVVASALATLPIFLGISKLLPDPSNY